MTCQACGSPNRADASFCARCGVRLARACTACGRPFEADARFCDGCGLPLADPAPAAASVPDPAPAPRTRAEAPPASYAPPPHLAARILRDRAMLEGERRTVTVLFIDAVRSVETTGRLDAEAHHRIVNRSTEIMIEAVNRFEGTVTQFRGDGLMAIFGAPIAHEDSARRGVAAAVAMRDALVRYASELARDGESGFAYRVGLNTGSVIVGRIGNDLSMDYTAIGDTVNLAARMEQWAAPGSIYVTDQTRRATAEYFTFDDLGTLEIKGKGEGVRSYEVIGELASRSRFDASVARGLTPYVGREQDIAFLRESFDIAQSGQGQVVFLAGDAGIGKSRLLLEFRRGLGEDVRWLEGHCLSYGRAMPYVPVVEIVRQALDVRDADVDDHIRAHIERVTAGWGRGSSEAAEQFAYLLSPAGAMHASAVGPEERRARILDALRALMMHISSHSPAVVVVEDVHWIDEQSEGALAALIDAAAAARVLLILTHRPGYTYPLGDRSFFNRRTLRSLPEDESSRLATQVLAEARVPAALRDLVIERAEGNPFYIEEVVHAVVESGALRRSENGEYVLMQDLADVRIPDTVQGVILSRLDRLSWPAKEFVQHAAIIGRAFPLRLVEHVLGPDAEVQRCLDELKALDLVYESAYFPEVECVFKHALTHEVALSTLLRERRREMHRRVAQAIEVIHAGRLADYCEPLAHHYFAGEDWERALAFARQSAERSLRLHAPRSAIEHLSRAIIAIERLGAPADPGLLRQRALALEAIGRFDDARADHEAIVASARASEDVRAEWQACVDLGMLWAGRDYARAGEYWRTASDLAEMDGDGEMIARSLNRLGNWHINVEDATAGREFHERALAIFETLGHDEGIAETLDFMTMVHGLTGHMAEALDSGARASALFRAAGNKQALSGVLAVTGVAGGSFETRTIAPGSSFETADERVAEALAIAREIGWRPGEAFALGVKVGLYGNHGRYEEAIAAGTEALSLSEEIGHRQWQTASHCILGMTYNSIFSADRGRYHLERALMLAHEIGSPYWQRDCAAHLAMSWLLLGNTARAAEVVDRAMTPDLPALVIGQRELWLSYGELCAAQGRWDDALAVTARLSNAPGVDGDLTRLPHVAWLAARAHAALGRIEEAERLLRGACDTAVTAAPVLTWQLQAELGSLLQARDAAEAAAWLAKAAAGADAIAQSLPPDLRASFLTAPAYTEVVRQPRPAAP